MGKDDWYFAISTLLGIAGLLGVPWGQLVGKAKAVAMRNPRKDILMAIALIGSLILSAVGWYQCSQGNEHARTQFPANYPVKHISDRTFANEEVELDGKSYTRCTFENVTFVYNGTAPLGDFTYNHIFGTKVFRTKDDALASAIAIFRGLGLIKSDIPILIGPQRIPQPNIQPPTVVP